MEGINKKALSASLVCALYDIEPGTLKNLRYQNKGPRFFKVNRKIFYRPEDVERWLFGNPIETINSVREEG